jgi:hypothetical protein
MRSQSTLYYIEVKEGKAIKRVPHTKGTKFTEFVDRKMAVDFLNRLVENNKGFAFRLCKEISIDETGPWLTTKSERGLTTEQLINAE